MVFSSKFLFTNIMIRLNQDKKININIVGACWFCPSSIHNEVKRVHEQGELQAALPTEIPITLKSFEIRMPKTDGIILVIQCVFLPFENVKFCSNWNECFFNFFL